MTAEISGLDTAGRMVSCADGSSYRYDSLLLGTGGFAMRPDVPVGTLNGVFVLRSRADADAIVAQAEQSEWAVVLGTGFIGMEVAASLRERGLDVTVVDAGLDDVRFGLYRDESIEAWHPARDVWFE